MNKPLTIYVLNLFDCGVTLWFFFMFGIGIESNPFGVALLQNPVLAVVFKVVIIGLALLVLYQYKDRKIAKTGTSVILGVYSILTLYHFFLIFYVLRILL